MTFKNDLDKNDLDIINEIRTITATIIANQLVNVQAMPNDIFKNLMSMSKSEKALKAEGYKPLSEIKLLWVKDDI